jgi:4-oxalocrotonate tautomerase
MNAMTRPKTAEKNPPRRRFLLQSAAALGTLAVFTYSTSPRAKTRESVMPHVNVKLFPGRSLAQKTALSEAIVRDVVEHIECSIDSISVAIEEIDPREWKEKVFVPEILAKPGTLFKKPGYSM